jgi:hypothetical protein
MRPLDAGTLGLLARLALAPAATAQDAPPVAQAVAPRLEIGATIGAIWRTPTIGIVASVPAAGRVSVEGGVNLTPHDVMAQAQVRLPLRTGPGSRRSIVAGLTHLSQRMGTGSVFETGLAAHAGMSAQAALSRRFDLRADVQLIAPFRGGADADLRAVVALVWHR